MPILSSWVSFLGNLQPVWEMWAVVWHESGLGALVCNPLAAVISHIWSQLIILGRGIWKHQWYEAFVSCENTFLLLFDLFAIIRMSVLVIWTKEIFRWKQKCSHEQIAAIFICGYIEFLSICWLELWLSSAQGLTDGPQRSHLLLCHFGIAFHTFQHF